LLQNEPTRLDSRSTGFKGSQSLGNKVGIHKIRTISEIGQKLPGEGGFAGTIWPGDNIYILIFHTFLIKTSHRNYNRMMVVYTLSQIVLQYAGRQQLRIKPPIFGQ
jgi:hypothetical protein